MSKQQLETVMEALRLSRKLTSRLRLHEKISITKTVACLDFNNVIEAAKEATSPAATAAPSR
jgi:hypothetical protein